MSKKRGWTADKFAALDACPCKICSSQDSSNEITKRKKYKSLSQTDLDTFQEAISKDYGIKMEGDELYQAAFNLLQFFEALIKFDKEGSKTVQDNPLYRSIDKHKIK